MLEWALKLVLANFYSFCLKYLAITTPGSTAGSFVQQSSRAWVLSMGPDRQQLCSSTCSCPLWVHTLCTEELGIVQLNNIRFINIYNFRGWETFWALLGFLQKFPPLNNISKFGIRSSANSSFCVTDNMYLGSWTGRGAVMFKKIVIIMLLTFFNWWKIYILKRYILNMKCEK